MNTTRRVHLNFQVPAETAIFKAMEEIENLGADEKLTDAIMKLSEVRTLISDYIDKRLGLL